MEQPGQRKVLVAVDGSETSRHAFEWYMANMKMDNDFVYGVVVAEFDVSLLKTAGGNALEVSKNFTEKFKEFENLTAEFTAMLRSKQVKGQFDTYSDSKPGEIICNAADSHNVDLILLGTRGLSKFKRALLGSVSQFVLIHSGRPVTIVPMPR